MMPSTGVSSTTTPAAMMAAIAAAAPAEYPAASFRDLCGRKAAAGDSMTVAGADGRVDQVHHDLFALLAAQTACTDVDLMLEKFADHAS